ncbi:sugar phosphate isomerase/epimerase family protein [Spirosoma agri]|uniref:Sugar phosphate isomerase/epimerase n=1 Tax=Spirosoma agri TaxID=1987381 RepID=A0A6M0IJL0_9BACT|nr:TIM barrel protein [Spirosoma agri]NEU68500.1 sugar phosphate isomerase/epimerase [Spirosoma agri]
MVKSVYPVYLLLALSFAGYTTSAQSKKPLYTFPLGVESYTYRAYFPKDVAATLDTIKALGFTELEGGAPKGVTTEEFRKMLDERGIKVPATGAGYEQIVKDPESVIKNAKTLGASYVMVAWIPHEKSNFTIDNAKKAVNDFNRVGKILNDNGLTLCYHNHGYEFGPYQNGTLFDYIVQNTNPKYVSFEMDILWAQHGGADPVKLLNKYGSRWKLMHLKDLKKGVKGDLSGGTAPENDVVLGAGQVDMPGVLKAAKKVGIKHYFIEDESNHEDVQVRQSIAYLKNLKD